jgi:hypothetical protein
MAANDDRSRTGVSRRDALRMLAASTTTVAAGSMIVSQPAHADNGSTPCIYGFPTAPMVSVRMVSQQGNQRDGLSITVTGLGNPDCPCGTGSAQVQYAYYVSIPNAGTGSTGWTNSSAVSVTSPAVLWPNNGGSATISVRVRVTCPPRVGTTPVAVACRSASSTFTIGRNQDRTFGFTLGSDNASPAGLPACDAPQLRSAGALTAGGSLNIVSGTAAMPTLDPNAADVPPVDLGPVEPAPANTDAATTTSTDKPGNGPKPAPSTTTTTPTTSTPNSPATPSTSTPPSTTTPPGG